MKKTFWIALWVPLHHYCYCYCVHYMWSEEKHLIPMQLFVHFSFRYSIHYTLFLGKNFFFSFLYVHYIIVLQKKFSFQWYVYDALIMNKIYYAVIMTKKPFSFQHYYIYYIVIITKIILSLSLLRPLHCDYDKKYFCPNTTMFIALPSWQKIYIFVSVLCALCLDYEINI